LNILTEMNVAIDTINKIYDDMSTKTQHFYIELYDRVQEMKKYLPDALITKNKMRQKFLADNPYFQDSEFPMGQSVFMSRPAGKKEDEQPQGNMIESIVIQRVGK
jgi:hypothetical protein